MRRPGAFVETGGLRSFRPENLTKLPVFGNPHLFQDVYCLETGQGQAPHTHANATKTYFVLEGRGRFLVGEVEQELGPGGAVCAAPGEIHGVTNDGPERLVLLVTMAPNPNFQET